MVSLSAITSVIIAVRATHCKKHQIDFTYEGLRNEVYEGLTTIGVRGLLGHIDLEDLPHRDELIERLEIDIAICAERVSKAKAKRRRKHGRVS